MGPPVEDITEYDITPLDPLDPETRSRMELGTPHELLQTFLEYETKIDIKEGHILIVDGVEYPVKSVAEYSYGGVWFYHVIVEELRP